MRMDVNTVECLFTGIGGSTEWAIIECIKYVPPADGDAEGTQIIRFMASNRRFNKHFYG
jgi:hypothetical protein|uniref:Uncharacterized protein n=2 Tax=Picea TaxID=3328 RepID=A0A124GN88_PICGL|nr:hypothetical protein ABT39_MTgene5063 [Picea glauca]QHR89752.1 hypothetical protein Q903MT_gene3774 [Picea sitchensis]